jgi:hypothetical protein
VTGVTGCDLNTPAPPAPSGSSVHFSANVSSSQTLPANGVIELAFNRLLLPSCITRQTFILQGDTLTPTIAYDPVARVVTVTPTDPLTPGQTYSIAIASPQNAGDPNGLRAIDGATLDPGSPALIEFEVTAAVTPAPPPPPTIVFCNDVFPTFSACGGSGCHGTALGLPAAGLLLTTPDGITQTAVGRVAHGANTGPRAAAQPPGLLFGEDMPIIDPGTGGTGNPGDSWLLYKMLMAVPGPDTTSCDGGAADASSAADAGDSTVPTDATAPATSDATAEATAEAAAAADDSGTSGEGGGAEDAGEDATPGAATTMLPTNVCGLYALSWQPLSSSERATLANLVPGREMPFPSSPSPDAAVGIGSPISDLERISLWIAQGATIPTGGCTQ